MQQLFNMLVNVYIIQVTHKGQKSRKVQKIKNIVLHNTD